MGLADHLEQPKGRSAGSRCRTCRYVEQMSDEDAEAFRQMLLAPEGFPDGYVAQIMEDEGYPGLTDNQIGHHRRKHLS